MKRTIPSLLAVMAIAVGCGDDEDAGGARDGGTGDGATTTESRPETDTRPDATPADRPAIIRECLERARSISDASARRVVEEACRAATTGDAEKALDAAREQCLESAARLPRGEVRDSAREACERVGK